VCKKNLHTIFKYLVVTITFVIQKAKASFCSLKNLKTQELKNSTFNF